MAKKLNNKQPLFNISTVSNSAQQKRGKVIMQKYDSVVACLSNEWKTGKRCKPDFMGFIIICFERAIFLIIQLGLCIILMTAQMLIALFFYRDGRLHETD